MASIAPCDFYMIDQWPGPVNPNRSIAGEKWDSTKIECGNNCSIPTFTPGTKILGFNDATVSIKGSSQMNTGGYMMIYLQYICSTTALDLSASDIVIMSCTSDGGSGHMACSRDLTGSNIMVIEAPAAIACADITPSSYGWFWCDGVAPLNDCTTLDVTGVVTDGSVVGGQIIAVTSDTTRATFSIGEASDILYGNFPVAFALKDDT